MKTILTCLAIVLLAGCASQNLADIAKQANMRPEYTNVVDEVLPVSDEHRPVRACLIAAGFAEVAAVKVERNLEDRGTVLGHVTILQNAIARVRASDPNWRNSEMGRVAITFGGIAIDIAQNKIHDYLTRGLSIETGLFGAKQVGVDAVMIPSVAADVRNILGHLEQGEMTEDTAWQLCEARIGATLKQLGN